MSISVQAAKAVKKTERIIKRWSKGETASIGIQATLNERGKTHGDFFQQADTSQRLKNVVMEALAGTNHTYNTAQIEALQTICMKMSRIIHGNPNEPDHWKDIAGYATLVENILVHGKSHLG